MAKFPTEIEQSVTVAVPPERAYEFLWDVVGSSCCVPGLARCERVGDDTYRFLYESRSTAGISMAIRYTARYTGNGSNTIDFTSVAAVDDNTDVSGAIRLQPSGDGATRVVVHQTVAPDTPVPRLLQGLVRSFVAGEAAKALGQYLGNIKRELEARAQA